MPRQPDFVPPSGKVIMKPKLVITYSTKDLRYRVIIRDEDDTHIGMVGHGRGFTTREEAADYAYDFRRAMHRGFFGSTIPVEFSYEAKLGAGS